MSIPIIGQKTTAPSINQIENKEPKNYSLTFRITDRQMKVIDEDFTKTSKRVSWEDVVEVNEATSEVNAVLGATFGLSKSFPASKYDIECISVKEKMIIVPKFIV